MPSPACKMPVMHLFTGARAHGRSHLFLGTWPLGLCWCHMGRFQKAFRVLLSVLNCFEGHIQILDLYAMLSNLQAVKPLCLLCVWFSTGYWGCLCCCLSLAIEVVQDITLDLSGNVNWAWPRLEKLQTIPKRPVDFQYKPHKFRLC